VLGDDAQGWYIEDWLPGATAQVQTVQPLRGAAVTKIPRGNIETDFSFAVARTHDNREDALSHVLETLRDLPGFSGTVEITHSTGYNRETSLTIDPAVIRSCRCLSHRGVHTLIQYTIEGGKLATDDTA